jgi:hypothetical protein
MPFIPNSRAISIIESATCIRVDGDEVLYPEVDVDDATITLSLNGGNKHVYIPYTGNEKVEVINCGVELRFLDEDGEAWDLMPLNPGKIEA